MEKSSITCGNSNALNGTEDDNIHTNEISRTSGRYDGLEADSKEDDKLTLILEVIT